MDRTKIEIRPSRKEDFKQLVQLDNLIWNNSNTPQPLNWESAEQYGQYCPEGSQFIAVTEHIVAGYIGFKPPTNLMSNKHVMEINIGVHPDFQGKGIGKQLLHFVSNWAKGSNIRKISLRVLSSNEQAISFYEANGFQEQGRLVDEFLIDDTYVDDILMYKITSS
jgi:ribosomal protein S18 acetylase RimI-like enzyme